MKKRYNIHHFFLDKDSSLTCCAVRISAMFIHSNMWQPIHFQIIVHSYLPTYNGYTQNRRRNVIDELIFIRMRGRESGNITKSIGVNSFVKSLKNVYELNIT